MTTQDLKGKHTPGPWQVHKGIDRTTNYFVCELGAHGFKVLSEHKIKSTPSYSYESTEADAHLIAAAPELLAALEVAKASLGIDPTEYPTELELINAAIAKAKGSV